MTGEITFAVERENGRVYRFEVSFDYRCRVTDFDLLPDRRYPRRTPSQIATLERIFAANHMECDWTPREELSDAIHEHIADCGHLTIEREDYRYA